MFDQDRIIKVNIESEMRKSYIDYSMSVIVSRALPDVRDGFKPVHRRILYGMKELGNTHDKPHKKCARVVGEVLGKYHPHGDSSVYGALVRMAQEWNMRYTLVDGQGNFGSVDGDGAAAMRYTESRLQLMGEAMMEDLDKEILEEVKKLAIEPGYYKSLRSSADDPEDKGAAIASEIKKIDAQISRFMDLYALGSMPVDVLDSKIKDLSMKKAALEENLQQIKADSSKLSIKEAEKLINKIPDILHNGSVEEIRHLLSDLIDKIEIDGDDISIYWRF